MEKHFTSKNPKHQCALNHKQAKQPKSFRKRFKFFYLRFAKVSEKNFIGMWYLRSKGSIEVEMMKQVYSRYWFVFHPFSMTRLIWEIWMVTIFYMSATFYPIRNSFLNAYMARYYNYVGRSTEAILIGIIVHLYLTMFWIIDMFSNFVTGYYDKIKESVEMRPSKIFLHYVKVDFVLDLSSSIPVDFLIVAIGGMKAYTSLTHSQFTVLVFYNYFSLYRFRQYIKYCFQFGNFGNISLLVYRILLAVLVYLCIINWTISLSLTVTQIIRGDSLYTKTRTNLTSWIHITKFFNLSLSDQYKTALMRAMHNYVVLGSPSVIHSPEDYLMAVIVCATGRIYWVYFLISFLEALAANNVLRTKFDFIREQLKTYMRQKELPVVTKKRLSRFYLYRFQAHYFRDRAILGRLTESLRKEIGMYTCQRLLHGTEIFQSLPKKVVARLIQKMNRELYFPQDVIIQGNTFGESLYFICSGTVGVRTISGKEIGKLEDGEFFGEIALVFQDRRRTATVTALTVTEVYRLEAFDYKKIIEAYPDVQNRLERIAYERYRVIAALESKGSRD